MHSSSNFFSIKYICIYYYLCIFVNIQKHHDLFYNKPNYISLPWNVFFFLRIRHSFIINKKWKIRIINFKSFWLLLYLYAVSLETSFSSNFFFCSDIAFVTSSSWNTLSFSETSWMWPSCLIWHPCVYDRNVIRLALSFNYSFLSAIDDIFNEMNIFWPICNSNVSHLWLCMRCWEIKE